MDFVYSGDMDLADKLFKDESYGAARCEYQVCLEKTKEYTPAHKNRIDYLEWMISRCNEEQSKNSKHTPKRKHLFKK